MMKTRLLTGLVAVCAAALCLSGCSQREEDV